MLIFVPFAEIPKNGLRKEGVPQSRAEGCGTQGGFLKWGSAAEAQPGPDRTAPTPSPIRGGSGGPAVAAFVQGGWGGCLSEGGTLLCLAAEARRTHSPATVHSCLTLRAEWWAPEATVRKRGQATICPI